MAPKLALLVYSAFVVLLFRYSSRRGWSKELWIPLTWLLIVASKPVGLWFALLTGGGRNAEGSNLDSAVYVGLLIAAFRVLKRRRVNWNLVFARNRLLLIYTGYLCISILWADFPFRSLKMWIKDAGNIVMVLVLLSEGLNGEGLKNALIRAAYILTPLSVLLVKYFPDLGRAYDPWIWQPLMVGASESKNALGATTAICSLGLLWSVFERRLHGRATIMRSLLDCLIVAANIWLLRVSNCATALTCAMLGVGLLILLRFRPMRSALPRAGAFVIFAVPVFVFLLEFFFSFRSMAVGAVGRDSTFTGRIPIWDACLSEDINPFFGSGYFSFWLSSHATSVSQKLGFYFNLKEAHDGYLETYLNSGLIGLGLLLITLFVATSRNLRQLRFAGNYPAMRLIFIVVGLLYNITESAFTGFNSVWFLLLAGMVEYPHRVRSLAEPRPGDSAAAAPGRAPSTARTRIPVSV